MLITGILIIFGALIDILTTGLSLVDLLVAISGIFIVLMKTSLGIRMFPSNTGANRVLSKLIIIAISIAIVIVPLSLVKGKGSGKTLDSVLEKSAALAERGEYDKAYKILSEFDGGNVIPEILQNKAAIHIRKGECQEAESLINEAAAYKNMDAGMLFNIGLCYFQNDHFSEAASYFEKAVLLEPDMWFSYYYAGEAFYRKKNFRSAEYYYNEALKIVPDNPNICYSLAQTKMDKMEFQEAQELLDNAKKNKIQEELMSKIEKLEDSIKHYVDVIDTNN